MLLGQSVWRNVNDRGLRQRYTEDDQLRMLIRCLPALAFVRPPDVLDYYTVLERQFPDDRQVDDLIGYFEETYIGRRLRNGRRIVPRFPVDAWNQYDRVQNELPRTNNHVEAWHRAIESSFLSSHPGLWSFLSILIKEESLQGRIS